MYERYTAGENPNVPPLSAATNGVEGLPPYTPAFQYTLPPDTNTPYILFVHGWNQQTWEKDRYAEAAYKRLYWQGYQGRFGSFRWPTGNGFDASFSDILTDARNYDNSEFQAWQSATGLTNLLTKLNAEYPGHVYLMAHSMGNVVAGEALRRANSQLVNTYVAMQGAVPSHAYDPSATTRVLGPLGSLDSGTPNCYAVYYASGAPCYFDASAGAGAYVNFYNTNDYALDKWQIDQNWKPDNAKTPGYHYSSSSGFYKIIGAQTNSTTYLSFPTNTFEIFAYGDEARCFALGAQAGVSGAFDGNLTVC
jgi:pimeloyl-ACP methyl ester carboxylesterase